MQGLQGLHHARMAGKRAQWLIGPHGCGRRGLRCGEGFGSGPPLAVGQPGPRRATDLLRYGKLYHLLELTILYKL